MYPTQAELEWATQQSWWAPAGWTERLPLLDSARCSCITVTVTLSRRPVAVHYSMLCPYLAEKSHARPIGDRRYGPESGGGLLRNYSTVKFTLVLCVMPPETPVTTTL